MLFNYFSENQCFPSVEKSAKIFGITKAKRPKDLGHFVYKVKRKIWK